MKDDTASGSLWGREAFRTNEQNLLNLVKASPLGIIAFDLNGSVLLWNKAAELISGWSEKEVFGQNIDTLLDENWESFEVVCKRILSCETFHSSPVTALRKDGRRIVISYSSAPVFNAENLVVGYMAVIYDISEKIKLTTEVKESLEKTNRILDETVLALGSAVEMRDPYTSGHQQRVAQLACAIAEELGWIAAGRLKGIWTGAMLHDIGKLYVPAEILTRPGALTKIEFEMMKCHTEVGYEILKDIEFPWPIAHIVRQHHERMDGSGYPEGLKGEHILFEARILGVADVVEAMSSHRPYRPSKGIELALEELRRARGTAYDPVIVDACLELFRKGFRFA